jgi:1-acyl-sn-glycerol-3-phosphate acyltransferase
MSLGQRLRASLRLVAVGVLTGLAGLALMIGLPFSRLLREAHSRWVAGIYRIWAHLFLLNMGVRVTVYGTPPKAPFFLVSNHLSYVDIPLLANYIDAAFISKAEVEDWPLMGAISRWAGTIFIDRSIKRDIPRVLSAIEERLARHQGVVVFPEGTSSSGAAVQRFLPSLLEIPAQAPYPVSYASLAYQTPAGENPAHLAVCWWGDMTFFKHFFALLAVRRFDASVTFGDEPITNPDRKQLAERLHRAVSDQFVPSAPMDLA